MRRKSENAVGEIAFANAGKNAIADFCATPTEFIFVEVRGVLPAEKTFLKYFYFQNHELCFTFLRRKNVATPQKTSYLERSAQEWSGEKKGQVEIHWQRL